MKVNLKKGSLKSSVVIFHAYEIFIIFMAAGLKGLGAPTSRNYWYEPIIWYSFLFQSVILFLILFAQFSKKDIFYWIYLVLAIPFLLTLPAGIYLLFMAIINLSTL